MTNRTNVREIDATGTPGSTTFLRGDGAWGTPAGGGSPTFVGAKVLRSTALALSAAVDTAIPFTDADVYDTDSIHDPATNPTRLTIPAGKGGKWRLTLTVTYAANTSGVRSIFFSKNGVGASDGGQRSNALSAGGMTMTSSVDMLLAAGDYVEFLANTSVALSTVGAYASIYYLGA